MKIAICDDDKSFCIKLEQYIDECSRKNDFGIELNIYYAAEDILADIKAGQIYDVIFLDIFMGELDGIEAGKLIRKEINAIHTEIVFVTSSKDHYEDALNLRTFRYLKKPIEQTEFEEIFLEIVKYFGENPKLFTYNKNKIKHYVRMNDIVYFEVQNRQVSVVTVNGSDQFYSTIKEVIDSIDNDHFLITHRAYYVNLNCIVENRGDSLLLINGHTVPVSDKRKKELEYKLMSSLFE